jgi:hypothetical protein
MWLTINTERYNDFANSIVSIVIRDEYSLSHNYTFLFRVKIKITSTPSVNNPYTVFPEHAFTPYCDTILYVRLLSDLFLSYENNFNK